MSKPDLMQLRHQAMRAAGQRLIATQRLADKSLATRPAVPLPKDPEEIVAEQPMDRRDRVMEYMAVRDNPERIQMLIDEAKARYKLPDHAPIPKTLVQWFIDGERDYQAEMKRLMPQVAPSPELAEGPALGEEEPNAEA